MSHAHQYRCPLRSLIGRQLLSVGGQRVLFSPSEDEIFFSRCDDRIIRVGEHRKEADTKLSH